MKAPLLASIAVFLLASFTAAQSQTYPNRPIRLISHAVGGAANDVMNRALAAKVTEILGQQVVVENRPGAGTTIAPAIAAKATPDGYTLLHCSIADAVAPALYQKLPYEFLRDFSTISLVGTTANILVVHPSVPARSVQDFISYVKERPGKMTYASAGVGSSTHLTMELFRSMTATDMLHVPYKGGPLLIADLLAGRVSTMMSNLPAQIENIKTGKVRALGVSSTTRSARLPEVPTIAESGVPGFEVTLWHGLCAPSAVPKTIVAKLNATVRKALSTQDLRSGLEQSGVDPQPSSPEQFTAFIKSETAKWARVVKEAGIPPQ
jgi:tripartite-type tricarboxylate transporter receptor subunit TctC